MYVNRKGIQFSRRDMWSLDITLSPIIHSALIKFKECSANNKGIPGKLLFELYPDSKGDYSEEETDFASTEWDKILDKMIYAFNLKNEPKIGNYGFKFGHFEFEEQTEDEKAKGLHRMSPITVTNEEEYQRYRDDEDLHWQKVDEGHLLFGKFYRCLWY